MNIDEYRAIKEESQKEETPVQEVATEELPITPEVIEGDEAPVDEPKVDEIEIEGIGKVSVNELKNGYLRQSDYTKKTQELAKTRKETEEAIKIYEQVKSNPTYSQSVGIEPSNPFVEKINSLEEKLYDMQLERDIEMLSSRYSDFEVREVLQVAHEKGITNLEDAYMITKSMKPQVHEKVDMVALREELKKDLMKELGISEKDKSVTVISSSSNAQITNNEPILSSAEIRVAKGMGMSQKEYATWRDKN